MYINNNDLVSIIIPTYKRPERIIACIDSVLNQTYKNIEVIVIDDNNIGDEWRIATELKMSNYKDNKQVIYIKHKQNKNGAVARNTGIKASNGSYIGFLDDDDLFTPEKIEKQISFLESHDIFAAVYCSVIKNGKRNNPKYFGNLIKELLLGETEIYTPTLLFRHSSLSAINGFNENFKRHQDFELLLRFFNHDNKIGLIPDPLVIIGDNLGENSLKGKEYENLKEIFLSSFESEISTFQPKWQNKIYCHHYTTLAFDYIKIGDLKNALRIIKKSLLFSYWYTIIHFGKIITLSIKYRLNK